MRGAARFAAVRELVTQSRRMAHAGRVRPYLARCDARLSETAFPGVSRRAFVRELRENGIAIGLKLPRESVTEIVAFAESQPCYADRNPQHGFHLRDCAAAEAALGRPNLLAQYINAVESPAIRRLVEDPPL
jgi:hypothetical protein